MIRVWAILVLCSLPAFASAQAAPRGSVIVDVEACGEATFDVLALLGHVRIELAAEGIDDVRAVPSGPPPDDALAWVQVTTPCGAVTEYLVRVEDRVLRKTTERRLVLDAMGPDAALRALALGIAELLRASWAELLVSESPRPSVPPVLEAWTVRVRESALLAHPVEVVEAPAIETPEPSSSEPVLLASGMVRAFVGTGAAPAGGRLSLSVPVLDALLLRFDAEVLYGTSIDPLGRIELGMAGGGLSVAYLANLDAISIDIGARIGAAGAWTAGTPSDPSVTARFGAGAVLLTSGVIAFRLRAGDVLVLEGGVEIGGAPIGLQALVDGVAVTGASGAFIAGWMGLGLML
jgi:hypothetical protein